ncbi:MAG: hypothetical protein MJ237_05460 [bacterium]|nr:hypothetical protein [bacterium]
MSYLDSNVNYSNPQQNLYYPQQQGNYAEQGYYPQTQPQAVMPATYDYSYYPQQKTPSAAGLVIGGAAVAAPVGGVIGFLKNPVINDNEVNSDFAVRTYEKYLNNIGGDEKKIYDQFKIMQNSIDKVKSPEELKNLFEKNPEGTTAFLEFKGMTLDEYMSNITDKNLKSNKKTIKNSLKTSNDNLIQIAKNDIEACWDTQNKKFVKADNVSEDFFKALSKTKNSAKWHLAGKQAAIAGGIGGALGLIAFLISSKKQKTQQSQYLG